MNQQQVSAYLNLIQALLACPDGEEWDILHQHEELINPEFVQLMEQVAQQFNHDGKLEAAQFLHHWVEQLNHVLIAADRSAHPDNDVQKYFNLIQAILNCPEGEEENILATNANLVDAKFIYLMRQVARQMAVRGEKETAVYLNNLAANISRNLTNSTKFKHLKTDPESEINQVANHPQLKELVSPFSDRFNSVNGNATYKSSPQPESQPQKQPEIELNQLEDPWETPAKSSSETVADQHVAELSLISHMNAKIDAIANSVHNLEQAINKRSQVTNPLWYMDILERAQTANWLLTSEEIEQLIGTKPKCETDKETFQRGCWLFQKSGKIGPQTAWKISKVEI